MVFMKILNYKIGLLLSLLLLFGCNVSEETNNEESSILYSVSYYALNAQNTPVDNNDYQYKDRFTISKQIPIKEGQTFAHWLYNGREYFPGDSLVIVENVRFEAVWRSKIHRVDYDTSGGGAIPSSNYFYGSTIVLPHASKEGYSFLYWLYNGRVYQEGSEYIVRNNVTFTAVWREIPTKKFSIVYQVPANIEPPQNGVYENGTIIKLPSARSEDNNSIVTKWQNLNNNQLIEVNTSFEVVEDTTFLAIVDEKEKHAVDYHYNSGRMESVEYYHGSTINPYNEASLSADYRYWHMDSEGGKGEQIQRNETLAILSNLDLYETGWVEESRNDWMSGISNELMISQVSIPGTHDSVADEGACGITQSESISQQLNAGVRFFDFRTRFFQDSFPMHHGNCFLNTHFDDEMRHIKTFLIDNPSEFVIVMMKLEHTEEGNSKTYQQVFDAYLEELNMRNMWDFSSSFISVAQARGKVILINRTNGRLSGGVIASSWSDNIEGTQNVGRFNEFRVQDYYNLGYSFLWPGDRVNDKKSVIKALLNEAANNTSGVKMTLNFSSGYYIQTVAPNLLNDDINPWLEDELEGREKDHIGIIISDYKNNNKQGLKDKIIEKNFQ